MLGRRKNRISTASSPQQVRKIFRKPSQRMVQCFKKPFSIELLKESAGGFFVVSFMVQLTWLFVYCSWIVGVVNMDFIYFIQP